MTKKYSLALGIVAGFVALAILCLWLVKLALEWDGSYKTVTLESAGIINSFVVPSHVETIENSLVIMHLKYPTGSLVQVKRADEDIRIVITASDKSKMRSTYLTQRFAEKLKKEGKFMMFSEILSGKENGNIYYVHTDNSGQHALVVDYGAWSHIYRVYRPLSSSIELDYGFSKKLGLNEFEKIDALVVQTVNQHRAVDK